MRTERADGGGRDTDGPGRAVPGGGGEHSDEVDEAERESFPASDPASSWAGVDRAPDDPPGAREPGDPD